MKQVWLVGGGEYSDRYTHAVCSSYEQACGVAVSESGLYVDGAVEMWEPEDGVPEFRLLYTCIVRSGRDSARPVDVQVDSGPYPPCGPVPGARVVTSNPSYALRWARAENYPTATEAEQAARATYDALIPGRAPT